MKVSLLLTHDNNETFSSKSLRKWTQTAVLNIPNFLSNLTTTFDTLKYFSKTSNI